MHKISRKKTKYTELFGKKQSLEFSVAISLIINLVLILGMLLAQLFRGVTFAWWDLVKFFIWHFVCNTILFYFLFLLNFKLIRSSTRKNRFPLTAVFGTLGLCCLLSPLLSQIQWTALSGEDGWAQERFFAFNVIKDFIVGLAIVLVSRNIYNNYKREQIIIANQKLKEENIRMRFEALKNQLDPHFLFNSLNTLNGLIGMDDDKAHEYVDNLSSVFRYTLQNKDIRTLQDEITYVESYTALLQIRYGENLKVEYEIDTQYRSYYIMPVSIQLLVENAVKHNIISNKVPLVIHIETTPRETILVSNRISPKVETSAGSGVGLANLSERYGILFRKTITISESAGVFAVEIPLIHETEKPRI